jgi:hypothetical protein
MTPWQSSTLLEVEADAQRARYDLALFAAWHTEAFARTKKLPDLAKLLARTTDKPKPADLFAKFKAVLAMFPREPRSEQA